MACPISYLCRSPIITFGEVHTLLHFPKIFHGGSLAFAHVEPISAGSLDLFNVAAFLPTIMPPGGEGFALRSWSSAFRAGPMSTVLAQAASELHHLHKHASSLNLAASNPSPWAQMVCFRPC